MNRVLLFKPSTFSGRVICWVTNSDFSHAAVEVDGVLYDSSESRGTFGVSSIDPSVREHIAYEFTGDLSSWVHSMKGKEYDWRGVIGWIFSRNDRKKFYCFETAWSALVHSEVIFTPQPDRVSGTHIVNALKYYKDIQAMIDHVNLS